MLNPSSDFPRVSLGITEEGSKYDAFPSNSLGAASELLNTPCRPLFSRLRAVGLSLVLQCTRGRPFVRLQGRPHGVFDSLRGSDSHLFSSWLHYFNFLDHIRKGCVPLFVPSSCRSRFCRATETGASRAWWVPLFNTLWNPSLKWGGGETWLNNKFCSWHEMGGKTTHPSC